MKAIDCKKCRSNIHKEEKELFLKSQYAMLKDAAYTFACYATVAVIAVQVRRGRSKDYIQKLFDEMVAIYDMPTVFGKELRMTDLMKQFENDYDIDFRRIKVHMESESEFVKGVM
ncbi:hypothetical protein [Ruminococcus sp.]|uniref:hypothetical protein n=1 Tax=Ruminococcus sp. TaxID=41978 RepID=UPI001564B49B|nr:hypothetical protein [Ruminococcus sp.]MBQ6250196.1 hypothetical protein [Ruminococcus sp.]